MLVNPPVSKPRVEMDAIANWYERLVYEELPRQLGERANDSDFVADVACVALNRLPPRYIRHQVDMAFYLSPDEHAEMEQKVAEAVRQAMAFVLEHGQRYR